MPREKMALGSLLARAFRGLPRQLSEGIVSRLKLSLRLQYYRAQSLSESQICRLLGIPEAPEEEWSSLLVIQGRAAQLESLADVHPLQALLCGLQGNFVGTDGEALQLLTYCQPILRYLAVVEGYLRRRFSAEFNQLLLDIYRLLSLPSLDQLVWGQDSSKLNTGVFAELLRAGRHPDAIIFGQRHQIDIRALTVLACELRQPQIFLLFGKPDVVIEGYTADIWTAATEAVIGQPTVADSLIFDLGYQGKYDYVSKIPAHYLLDFLIGALLGARSEPQLFPLLPAWISDEVFYSYVAAANRLGNPYRIDNGLPARWREMLAQEPTLREPFLWLAAWAGQTAELAVLWREEPAFSVGVMSANIEFLRYAPTVVYQFPELQELRQISTSVSEMTTEPSLGKIRQNPDFFRTFSALQFSNLDPTGLSPEDFLQVLPRIGRKTEALSTYLNWQSLQEIPYSPAWAGILAASGGVPAQAKITDFWVFRRRFRQALQGAADFDQVWRILAEVGTPLTLRRRPGVRQVGRVDLGRFSDLESDLDVGEQMAELLNS